MIRADSPDNRPPGFDAFSVGAAVFLAALTASAHLAVLDRGFILIDEGHIAEIARRILDGEVLYRDVQTGIFPAIYYLAAGLFQAFGSDLIVLRIAALVINVATALGLWRLGVRVLPRAWALLAPILYASLIALGFPILVMLTYSALAMLFALAALLAAFRYLERARTLDAVLCGAALAVCALSKQNYGALAGATVAFALLWGRSASPLRSHSIVRVFAPVVVAGAVSSAAALAPLIALGAGPNLFRYTVLTLFEAQFDAFNQPLPSLFSPLPVEDGRFTFLYCPGFLFNALLRGETFFGLPVGPGLRAAAIRVAYGLTLSALVLAPLTRLFGRGGEEAHGRRSADTVVVAGALLFVGIFPSAIWSHLVAVVAPVLLLAAMVLERMQRPLDAPWARSAVGAVGVGAASISLMLAIGVSRDVRRWNPTPLGLAGASLRTSPAQAQALGEAAAFLERCAPPGEPVWAAPDMPGLLFVVDRPNPTPYGWAIPGDIDTRLIIERLEASGARCIVYNPRMYIHFNELRSYFPELVDHLETRYRPTTMLGANGWQWQGLERVDAANTVAPRASPAPASLTAAGRW